METKRFFRRSQVEAKQRGKQISICYTFEIVFSKVTCSNVLAFAFWFHLKLPLVFKNIECYVNTFFYC